MDWISGDDSTHIRGQLDLIRGHLEQERRDHERYKQDLELQLQKLREDNNAALRTAEKRADKAQQDLRRVESELEPLKRAHAGCLRGADQAESELRSTKTKLERETDKLRKAESELQHIHEEHSKCGEHIEEMGKVEGNMNRVTYELQQLREKHSKHEERIKEMYREQQELTQCVAGKNFELQEVKEEGMRYQQELHEARMNAQEPLQQLENKLTEKERELSDLRLERGELLKQKRDFAAQTHHAQDILRGAFFELIAQPQEAQHTIFGESVEQETILLRTVFSPSSQAYPIWVLQQFPKRCALQVVVERAFSTKASRYHYYYLRASGDPIVIPKSTVETPELLAQIWQTYGELLVWLNDSNDTRIPKATNLEHRLLYPEPTTGGKRKNRLQPPARKLLRNSPTSLASPSSKLLPAPPSKIPPKDSAASPVSPSRKLPMEETT